MQPLIITTIGDGAMATVCSEVLAGKSSGGQPVEVRVWGRDAGRLAVMDAARENARYLPGVKLSDGVRFIGDDEAAFAGAQLILCAVPTQYIRASLSRVREHIPAGVPVVTVAKGIETSTLRRPSEIIEELLGEAGERPAVAALSGPCIAGELARRLPATVVVATNGMRANIPAKVGGVERGRQPAAPEEFARWIQEIFTTPYLRVYRNQDLVGVELAGALKNVIAIAAGILDGMRAGNNAKAALLTRGLVEITRLGVALGAQAETFAGLAGMGDLVTTCVSPEGRNRSFGERIGRGEKPADVLASLVGVVEGMPTCESVVRIARAKGIDMPISESLYGVLFEGRDPPSQLADLMARELKSESE
ncbi:MAG TPA: NAD(P)H-dependent glycerol-3-phosphate dehydrogenase [Phycisphaerae bacterium]|jgi:glycerol-3-phosphate dehydrogenase (NAD(P)+)